VTEPGEAPDESAGDIQRSKGFRSLKREDHALMLIRDLMGCLDDMPRVRELMRELSRYYDPVLGGAILEVTHQRAIVEAIESGRPEEAKGLIRERYDLYVRDRAHLGRGEEG